MRPVFDKSKEPHAVTGSSSTAWTLLPCQVTVRLKDRWQFWGELKAKVEGLNDGADAVAGHEVSGVQPVRSRVPASDPVGSGSLLTPFDIWSLAQALFPPVEYDFFENKWTQLAVRAVERNRTLGPGDPRHMVNTDMLMGTGNYARADGKAGYEPLVHEQCQQTGMAALVQTIQLATPQQSFATIIQGVDEPFLCFAGRLTAAVEKQVSDPAARKLMLQSLARSNCNAVCKRIIESLPGEPSMSEMVGACARVTPSSQQMVAVATAVQPAVNTVVQPTVAMAVQQAMPTAVQPAVATVVQPTVSTVVQPAVPAAVQPAVAAAVQPAWVVSQGVHQQQWGARTRKKQGRKAQKPTAVLFHSARCGGPNHDANACKATVHVNTPVNGDLLSRLAASTHGSAGVDVCTAESVMIDSDKIHKVPLDAFGPFGDGMSAFLMGRSSATIQGIIVHLGLIDAGFSGQSHAMVSTPTPPLTIPKGTRIAQLVPFKSSVSRTKDQSRGDGGFGSTGPPQVRWTAVLTKDRPETLCTVSMVGATPSEIHLHGLLDTGADMSILSLAAWPPQWPLSLAKTSISGLGGTKQCYVSRNPVAVMNPEGQMALIWPHVAEIAQNLWGRDVLAMWGEQLEQGHLEPSTSPWNTPVFCIKKKSGKWRLLQDLRKINAMMEGMGTLQAGMPLPTMLPVDWPVLIVDLKDCFFTIPLHPDDRPKFAFTVPTINNAKPAQQYQWKFLPQGMRNSPVLCQWYVARALSGVRKQFPGAHIYHYMDDILVAVPSQDELLRIQPQLLNALHSHGLQVAPEKAKASHGFFHQNAHTLQKQFQLTATEACEIVKSCDNCHDLGAPLPAGVNPRGLKALELWQTDVTQVAEFGQLKYVHVTVDTFSSVMWTSAHTGEKACDVIAHWRQAFAVLGIPSAVKTDNGPAFASQQVRQFLQSWGVSYNFGIPHSPTGQAIVERNHGTLKRVLQKQKQGMQGETPHSRLAKTLYTINHLTAPQNSYNPVILNHHLSLQASDGVQQPRAKVRVRNLVTKQWEGPYDLIAMGRGYACVSTDTGTRWLPSKCVRPDLRPQRQNSADRQGGSRDQLESHQVDESSSDHSDDSSTDSD
ncbi:hypothetical protein DUI87_21654 [Hirundo rustica rustica]|uniref:Uncharacterized protein n=1 Tax=Hirundo rustica rustica TaxID=333673 RepID=A0A3M0JMV4_HIRRU|nr:hypothetical protein DUI87_21654 [Hirundo rustica rustica]